MNRFSQEHTPHDIRRRLVPSVVLTLGCVLLLWKFSSSVTETTNHAQMENLKQAILRSAVHCYAVEGTYPSSLSYLEKHYGISWNPEEYAVDYEVFSSNLPPTVTVIDLQP